MSEGEDFTCPECGGEHEGLPTDYAFREPDEVFALGYLDKYRRVRINADVCALDDTRHFIRGVLQIPFTDRDDCFAWGLWAQVSRADHDDYLRLYYEDASGAPRFPGRLANDIGCYESTTLGLAVQIQLGRADERPRFYLTGAGAHPLTREQSDGIDAARQHALLAAMGYFEPDD